MFIIIYKTQNLSKGNMERVSVIQGKLPVLIFAPHGFRGDDFNTNQIAKMIAKRLNCFAVINNGWERSEIVDIWKDKANCNNVEHCHEDVVKEEVLDPILRIKTKILKYSPIMHMFVVHGMSSKHIKKGMNVDMVVGFGTGSPNSLSCDSWRKNCIIHELESQGINVFEAKSGGLFSGWARNNMNQLFRKWYYDDSVQSFQIEIIDALRDGDEICDLLSDYFCVAIKNYLSTKIFDENYPVRFF